MIAFRQVRRLALFGFVIALAVCLCTAPADAGGYQNFHKAYYFGSPKHISYGHYCPTAYQPMIKYIVRPISYPVTYYDCYGQPNVVWQTSYRTVPITYLP